MRRKKSGSVDIEIQVLVIGALILLVTLQSFLIGWGMNKAAAIAANFERPDRSLEFFKLLVCVLVPIVILNALVGTHIARKLSGPLGDIRRVMNEIARGNLEHLLDGEPGEFLSDYKLDCNKMSESLRRLIYRDHQHAAEANEILSQCQKALARQEKLDSAEREKLDRLLTDAKSRLSIINDHFMKGHRIET